MNPALAARAFLLTSWAQPMTTWVAPFTKVNLFSNADAVSSATPLAALAEDKTAVSLQDLFLGNVGGAIGETCSVALLLGGIYLLVKKVISWHIPVAFIGTTFIFSLALHEFDFMFALSLVLSGGLLIGAIFMATDYVTSPTTPLGKLVFGIGAGLITVLIREWGIYPEGVSFAILIMNILNPYIDSLTARKMFGGAKK